MSEQKPTPEEQDEIVERMIEEQVWKDEDYAEQLLEEEALSHGFG